MAAEPQLRLIHGSILAGTLALFAVAVWLAPADGAASVPLLRWAWLGPTVAAVFVVGFVRGKLPRGASPDRVRVTGIVIWALAEGSALLGIVSTWISGELVPALGATLVGVFLLVHHRPSTLA